MCGLMHQDYNEWTPFIKRALYQMDAAYLQELKGSKDWLPGFDKLFEAFHLPLRSTKYILLGESPYPRAQSANGYAFWDNAVQSLWSEKGMSKAVNRATSLRNLLKMLLHAQGSLNEDFSQEAIAKIDKSNMIQTAEELFTAFMNRGVLLLNATLVYSEGRVNYHAQHWRPFIHSLLMQLTEINPSIELILFGKIAQKTPEAGFLSRIEVEHPYNCSFITNTKVMDFFRPFNLLEAND